MPQITISDALYKRLCGIADQHDTTLEAVLAGMVGEFEESLPNSYKFFERSLDMFALSRSDGYFIHVNPAFTRVLGYSRAELLSKPFLDFVHPDDRERTIQEMRRLNDGIAVTHFENRYRCKEGRYKWLSWTAYPSAEDGIVYSVAHDVTQQREAEDAIRRSRQEVITILESIGDAFFALNHDWQFIYVNTEAEKLVQRTRDELLGQSVWEMFPEAVETSFYEQYHKAMREGVTVTFIEYYPPLKTWFDVRAYPSEEGISVYFRDINVLKQAQEQLEASEARYRLITQNATDMISRHELDGRYMYVSPSTEVLLGYKPDELIGRGAYEFFHPEDIPTVSQSHTAILDKNTVYTVTYRIRHKSGNYIWFETTSRVLEDDNGSLSGIVAISRDVSDRKQAEFALQNALDDLERRVDVRTRELSVMNQQLQQEIRERIQTEEALKASEARITGILSIAADAIIVIDDLQRIVLFNQGAENIFGYRQAEVIGKPLDILLPERYHERHRQHIFDFANNGDSARRMYERGDVFALRKDGTEFPAEATISKLWQSGQMMFTVILRDITRRLTIEEELRKALARERELNELKSRFVSIVSHEFRTPLAVVLSASEMLRNYFDRINPETRILYIDRIKSHVRHLTSLIDNVLIIGKHQAVQLPYKPVLLDLPVFCQEIIDEFQMVTGETLRIQTQIAPDCRYARLDPDGMRYILVNLLSNAVKYSPEGGEIVVGVACPADDVILTVADSGIGIPEEDQKHLFQPFHRAANVGAIPGTGLGLVIIQQVVEMHGGAIEVESKIGVGTTFRVALPANPASDS